MTEVNTWCYFTKFVCRYDQLDEAKSRHQQCVDALRETHTVHFSSEQAYDVGENEPIFSLLLEEIVLPGETLTPEEKEEYSVFIFVTIIDIPESEDPEVDAVWEMCENLEIDFEPGIPAKFPSRTRAILVSKTGHELERCIYQ